MTTTVTMLLGDVRDRLADLPDASVDFLVTSPPFLALRSYLPADHPDKHREIGSEPTPAAFLDTLYGLTADWGRVVAEWGSIAVELGDTMSGSGGAGGDYGDAGLRKNQPTYTGSARSGRHHPPPPPGRDPRTWRPIQGFPENYRQGGGPGWPLAKSMCILPHAYTLGLAYGHNPLTGQPSPAGQWRIRNVICWARPNPPVGSLGKRNPHTRTGDYKFRPATSYITVACRGTGRYFDLDAVRTEHKPHTLNYADRRKLSPGVGYEVPERGDGGKFTGDINPAGAPPLDWHTDDLDGDWLWRLPTQPYSGSHYATFPVTLPRRLILAMCPARVCTVCGWPSERVTAPTPEYAAARAAITAGDEASVSGRSDVAVGRRSVGFGHGGGHASTISNGKVDTVPVTLGWTDCGHDAWRPGHVLDPFGGSGTTAVAAALEGRDCTLIDLDARNVDLVDKRLRENVRVVSREDHDDRVVWTVDVVSQQQLEHDAAGQMGLFA